MTTQPENAFLTKQADIMKQREAFRAEAKKIVAGTVEQQPHDPSAPSEVETYDVSGKILTTRDIPNDRPLPQRIARPELPALKSLKLSLTNIGNAVDEAREKFQADNASLDTYFAHDEQKQLRSEIADLHAELAEKQARLHELESKPSPRDAFYASIRDEENAVVSIARQLVERLSSDAAHKVFGVSLKQLSAASRRDIQLRFLNCLADLSGR
jgi:hypothetical protein